MDEWWSEIDDVVVACLSEIDGTSPDEIGHRLGMSEEAAVSILGMLAQQGRVRISRVEAVQGAAHAKRAGDVDRRRQVRSRFRQLIPRRGECQRV